jgi:putative hydrolase
MTCKYRLILIYIEERYIVLKIGVDCHVHTLFSGHAYSTVRDNILEAKERGLQGIGITDHFGGLFFPVDLATAEPDRVFATIGHMLNPTALPKVWHGVRLYWGVEIDIDDTHGNLYGHDIIRKMRKDMSLADAVLSRCDYAIASVHSLADEGKFSVSEGTRMYLKALENPKVKILGHIGRAGIPFDIDEVLTAAKSAGKVIEINDHSLSFKQEVTDTCHAIAIRCAELGVKIAVNSDAHSAAEVGVFTTALTMLEDIGFPQELVVNTDIATFEAAMGI